MSRHDWGDVIGLLFILAVIMILTRRSSQAPVMIGNLGDAFAAIVSFATDSGNTG